MTARFTGWPEAAFEFYEGLLADNSKAYWTAHKTAYDETVRARMDALLAAVEPEFGPGSVFRPYRDVRFAKDKTPYKTHIGATVGEKHQDVYYVQFSNDGLMVAAGMYAPARDQLDRYRRAVDHGAAGTELTTIVRHLVQAGYEIAGETLKTVPRGCPKEHPRLDLLRHTSLYAKRAYPPAPWLHTAKALDRVVTAWRAFTPLNRWFATHVGPSELPPR